MWITKCQGPPQFLLPSDVIILPQLARSRSNCHLLRTAQCTPSTPKCSGWR